MNRQIRGAVMQFWAASSGFVVVLLSVSVIQGQKGWEVTYPSTQICGIKGSTVEISCTYTHSSTINDKVITVNSRLWFTKGENNAPVDLTTDSDYTGRVRYHCENNKCTLTITDLRLSDSAVYKFRFITTPREGSYTGLPGVTLSITNLQMQVIRSETRQDSTWAEVKCHSSCLPDNPTFIWYKNGQKIWTETTSPSHAGNVNTGDYSCAVKGHENFPSPSLLIQAQSDWGVTYPSAQFCGIKGSTVDIPCSYRYPPRMNNIITTANKRLWFVKGENESPVDLKTESDYTGRVEYVFYDKVCTLRIKNLRLSDSAVYKFRFISNQKVGRHTGLPGVTLSVTDLQMQVIRSETRQDSIWAEVKCHSSCLPDNPTFIWYKSGQKIWTETTSPSHAGNVNTGDYSCAVKGHENFPSPSLYSPKVPSVSVSPSAEIVEGSSVTLTCSSDSNPAANYTWYKENERMHQGLDGIYQFTSISSEDRGIYYCKSEDQHSTSVFIDVQYFPKVPSVSVSPSAEIVEGSSVNLTCSSDSNPAANYTWYKENEDSAKASGQIFTINDFRPEHSGNYYCEAQNTIGRQNSTLQLVVVAGGQFPVNIRLILVFSLTLFVLSLFTSCCWIQLRKKKKLSCTTDPKENRKMREPDSGPEYENISALRSVPAEQTDNTYEQFDSYNIYANTSVQVNHCSTD